MNVGDGSSCSYFAPLKPVEPAELMIGLLKHLSCEVWIELTHHSWRMLGT